MIVLRRVYSSFNNFHRINLFPCIDSYEAARTHTFNIAIVLHTSHGQQYLNRWTICIELLNILHLSAREDQTVRKNGDLYTNNFEKSSEHMV